VQKVSKRLAAALDPVEGRRNRYARRRSPIGSLEEGDHVDETVASDSTDDAHGEAMARAAGLVREDNPEFDEALDPEFEPVFEVEIDPALEERDIHEADEILSGEATL